MAIKGAKPKPPGEAINRNQPTHEWVEVENVANTKGRRLTKFRANGQPWSRRSKERWEVWRKMPHTVLWTDSDWDFALEALELVVLWHESAQVKYATELRYHEKSMGTTADYRRDLRIRYVDPKPHKLASVVKADDFRSL